VKKLSIVALVAISMALAGVAVAGDEVVTMDGKIVCAKCTLHDEGLEKCQNVLIVEADGKTKQFYLTMTEANKKFGDVCMAKRPVTVTGTVTKKDGKMWLAAKEITPKETKG
jgi:hypothetical protein